MKIRHFLLSRTRSLSSQFKCSIGDCDLRVPPARTLFGRRRLAIKAVSKRAEGTLNLIWIWIHYVMTHRRVRVTITVYFKRDIFVSQ